MAGLPQFIEEDIQCMDESLSQLLERSEATAAFIIDKGGPLIAQSGDVDRFDTTTIAALAAGSFSATQAIAERCGEINFSSIYQQGDHTSMLFRNIDDNVMLVILFRAALSVGAIKYYGDVAVERVASQLQRAQERGSETVDLVSMNSLDAGEIFRKQSVCPSCSTELAAGAKFCPECGTKV